MGELVWLKENVKMISGRAFRRRIAAQWLEGLPTQQKVTGSRLTEDVWKGIRRSLQQKPSQAKGYYPPILNL